MEEGPFCVVNVWSICVEGCRSEGSVVYKC